MPRQHKGPPGRHPLGDLPLIPPPPPNDLSDSTAFTGWYAFHLLECIHCLKSCSVLTLNMPSHIDLDICSFSYFALNSFSYNVDELA